jgi:CubicO group peptidase (beta-lactamase class C family)
MYFPGTEWTRVAPEAELMDSATLEDAVAFLEANSSFNGVETLAIIRNGRMIWSGGDIEAQYWTASAAKSFTSTVLGLLIDDGMATLDTLAKDYVPVLANHYPDVTLRHFATMTSGYRPAGSEWAGPWGWTNTPFTPREPWFEPGSQFFYQDPMLEQMARALTQIAQESMEPLFQRRIADPIGMDRASWDWWDFSDWNWPRYEIIDGFVHNFGSDGMYISAQEAARFGHLFLNRGQWDGQQLISQSWVDEATKVQVPPDLPMHPANPSPAGGPGVYGYNWWVNGVTADGSQPFPGAPSNIYYAHGMWNNYIIVVPDWNMVVVRLGNDGPGGGPVPGGGGFDITGTTWGTFFSGLGSALLPATEPITLAISPGQSYTVADNDQDAIFDDLGDVTKNRQRAMRCSIGEVDLDGRNSVARLVARFGLANLPRAADRLESATLRFFLEDIDGLPTAPVSIWHSIGDNDTEEIASDYEDLGYEDTLLDLVTPGDKGQAYYEVDVTEFVAADYAADETAPQSTFRLQMDGATFLEDAQSHRYRFTMPGADANHPELVLTFIPEPSTFLLALVALGVMGISLIPANNVVR